MAENPFDGRYGKGKTEYEKYIGTESLLRLQKEPGQRTHPDELLFQSVHQVEEIWFQVAIHELGEFVCQLDADDVPLALKAIRRAIDIEVLATAQLKLFESMLPSAYLAIRKGLGSGSGLDSPGYNRINEIAPDVWAAFERTMERRGADLLEIYQEESSHTELLSVAEAMITFDSDMQRFKQEHIMVVKRIIGIGTASLRGNPINMLERSAKLTYFPMLWAVRDRIFIDFKAGPALEG